MQFTGVLGYTMWGFIHVLYLIGWGNRLGTLYTWARALTFSHNRGPPDHHVRRRTRVRPGSRGEARAVRPTGRPTARVRPPGCRARWRA